MKALSFTFDGATVRAGGEPTATLFAARDVCAVLGISWSGATLAAIPAYWQGMLKLNTPGGVQEIVGISEAAVYKLAFRSNKPKAEEFTNWVASEVLPAIRKTGSYQLAPVPVLPQSYAEALRVLADTVEEKDRLALAVADMEPKAAFFDAVADCKTAIEMAEAAKVLAVPGIGRNNLFKFLRDKKVLLPNSTQPYQEYIDRGYFRRIEQRYETADGETRISFKSLVYQKGLEYIRQLLTADVSSTPA